MPQLPDRQTASGFDSRRNNSGDDRLGRFAVGIVETVELDAKVRGELRGLMNNYLAHLLGHRPRMQEYLTA